MVLALGVVPAATRAGFCRVDSIGSSSQASTLRGVGLPAGGLNAELLCVLGVQSLPAAELHGLGADDASNRPTGEKPIQHIEADVPARSAHRYESTVDVVPKREPSAAASQRLQFPADVLSPQLNSSSLGASARFTWVSDTCGVGAPTVESFAVPTVPRFRSESNGAHSRRCSGSVSAFQTLAGGWRRSRTRTSVHFSPSFRTSAPAAGPGAYF